MISSGKAAAVGLGVLVLLGGGGLFVARNPPPAETAPGGGASRREDRPAPAKTREPLTRDALLKLSDRPADLMAALDLIAGTPLESDPEVIRAYIKALDPLSPGDLAELTIRLPGMEQYVVRHLTGQKDGTRLAAMLSALRTASATEEQKQIASRMLKTIVEQADYFGSDRFNDSLALLHPEEGEMKAISAGLIQKIWNEPDAQKKVETIDAFLLQLSDPALLDRLVGERIGEMSFADAEAWLLTVDSPAGGKGDSELMRKALKQGDVALGTGYVNRLLDAGQDARAIKASEALVRGYASRDPKGALDWVLAMPPQVKNSQMVTTAFSHLYRRDPETARQVLQTLDPALKSRCENTARVIDQARD